VIRARELWKKTLSGDPDNPSVWINMGYSYENEGNCEQALIHYKKAADLKKNDAQIQINIGNVYTTLGQYTDALAAYRQALNSPQRAIALYNVFLVYVKKRDKELAEKTLVQLAQEFASSSNTKRAQADMAVWNGDTAGATSIIENLSDKEPGDWLTLAQLHASRGNAQKATSALGNVPDEAQYRAGRAAVKVSLAFQQGQYAEVIAAVRESRDTGFAAQYNVALANYQLKNYSEALSVASRLARTAQGSDRADLCRLAGNAAFSLKQWEAARQWYSQLSNIEARSAIVQYNLAVASYNLGQPDESYAYYLKSRELDPAITNADIEKRYAAAHNSPAGKPAISMVDSLYNAAVDFQTAGSDSAAQALYLDVLSRDSTYNMAWNNLGAIHGKRGEIDSAEYAYMRAIGKRYDIPETYANLINLYIQLEEFSKARIWLIKGIGHNPESEILQELKKALQDAEKKAKKKR
nr:tetratricopeptide repeat protein [Chitinispirillaceae bacterium]